MSIQSDSRKSESKYKIGKVKQTPPILKDLKTGLEYIELRRKENQNVYGVTKFSGNYKEERKLGQGTFGEVYRGIYLETQRQVAMKKILVKAENDLFPITAQREITILKKLNHKNIVKLIEIVYDVTPMQNGSSSTSNLNQLIAAPAFYMILPYMVADLSGILHNPRIHLDLSDIKNMMLQIFEGINYIHCKKFMHRDIKTANILIDHKGILKLADFGLARNYYGCPPNFKYPGGAGMDAKYTSVVVTRWYRAPELVLGDKNYTTAVDIWGVGCVFAEFFEKRPILQGNTDIDQGHVIFKLMGTPNKDVWELARYLPGAELTKTNYPGNYRERFGKYLNESGLDLLSKLLALDPYKRLTAMSAKMHPFFSEEPLPRVALALPCEESHESDIKRYKQEINQGVGQNRQTSYQSHMNDTSQSDTIIKDHKDLQMEKSIPTGPRPRDTSYLQRRPNHAVSRYQPMNPSSTPLPKTGKPDEPYHSNVHSTYSYNRTRYGQYDEVSYKADHYQRDQTYGSQGFPRQSRYDTRKKESRYTQNFHNQKQQEYREKTARRDRGIELRNNIPIYDYDRQKLNPTQTRATSIVTSRNSCQSFKPVNASDTTTKYRGGNSISSSIPSANDSTRVANDLESRLSNKSVGTTGKRSVMYPQPGQSQVTQQQISKVDSLSNTEENATDDIADLY